MANLVKQEMYIKSNVAGNNNKFWKIQLFDDASVHVFNGRVGTNGQIQPIKEFSSMEAAEAFWDKKIREKQSPRKGYVKFKGILDDDNGGGSGENVTQVISAGANLESVALKQISSTSPDTAKLIKYLSKQNIHNITSSTTMKYDTSKGVFKTPLGIVTQDGIDEARGLLDKLVPYVQKSQYGHSDFVDMLQQYIQLIPRKVGRKLTPEDILPDTDAFQKEGQLLDALDASLQQVLSGSDDDAKKKTKKKTDTPKIFNVKLDVMDNRREFKRIEAFYNKTRNRMHTSYKLGIKKIYTVEIEIMQNAFEKFSKKIGNIMELWHGTRVENVLSILKGGLVIPKSSASHVTGRMFGDGIYFSDQSTKSLNYAQGYWGHGSTDNNCFMFLCSAAMGKYYVPSGPSHNFPKPGYDSTFAKARKSGVMNNEMIVYSTYRCNLNYLVEFSS